MSNPRRTTITLRQHPTLWQEVHPLSRSVAKHEILNSALTIDWKCRFGHVWKAKIRSRHQNKSGCPFCCGQRTDPKRSLARTHPRIAIELDVASSGVSPTELMPSSKRKVWWICSKSPDHKWLQSVGARTRKTNPAGCPYCRGYFASPGRNLAELFPDIAQELDAEKTDLRPTQIPPKSGKSLPWKCSTNPSHRWVATVVSRTHQKSGCPYCSNNGGGIQRVRVEDSLSTTHPVLASQWHPDNPRSPSEVTAGSGFIALWQCPRDPLHTWTAKVYTRTRRQSAKSGGCPICASRVVAWDNSLAASAPELASQWHPTLNGDLTTSDVVPGSRMKAWWKCDVDDRHVWEAAIFKRNSGADCPYCIPAWTSKQQIRLALECQVVLGIDPDDHKIRPKVGRVMDCDIIDRERRIVIEFDGSHWHSSPEATQRDERKLTLLESEGWHVIRVREKPLKCTRSLDISVRKGEGVHKMMLQLVELIHAKVSQLENRDAYVSSNKLWSRGKFHAYYSDLLTEQKNMRDRRRSRRVKASSPTRAKGN